MTKRLGFLFVLALAVTASFSAPREAASSKCVPPACFASPGCCFDYQCASWCASTGGGTPRCGGNGSGGCCSCEYLE